MLPPVVPPVLPPVVPPVLPPVVPPVLPPVLPPAAAVWRHSAGTSWKLVESVLQVHLTTRVVVFNAGVKVRVTPPAAVVVTTVITPVVSAQETVETFLVAFVASMFVNPEQDPALIALLLAMFSVTVVFTAEA